MNTLTQEGADQTDRYNDRFDRGDMISLGPKEAAMAIGPSLQADASAQMDPELAHGLQFIKEICGHLGIEPSIENIERVRLTLREHRIKLHSGHEYPKWVGEGRDAVIVNSREEEDKWHSDHAAPVADDAADGIADHDPTYEPFAGSNEPDAPNRPTEPAPVASPVSDNHPGMATPNPQPTDPRVRTLDDLGTDRPAPPRTPKRPQ